MDTIIEPKTISVIKLFAVLEKQIAKVNTYPLIPNNLVVQRDAYMKLATDIADEGREVPFATLEAGRKEQDADLRFALELFAQVFALSIEGFGSYIFRYDEVFSSEKDAANGLLVCLQLLSSGQMAVLETTLHGKACASEILLYRLDVRTPTVIATRPDYPRTLLRQPEDDDYDIAIMRNNYTAMVDLPKKLFLLEYQPDGAIVSKGRTFTSPGLTPLTKQMYNLFLEETVMQGAGRRPGETDWKYLYRSWEFWAITAFVAIIAYGGRALGVVPSFLTQNPYLLWPVTTGIAMYATIPSAICSCRGMFS